MRRKWKLTIGGILLFAVLLAGSGLLSILRFSETVPQWLMYAYKIQTEKNLNFINQTISRPLQDPVPLQRVPLSSGTSTTQEPKEKHLKESP